MALGDGVDWLALPAVSTVTTPVSLDGRGSDFEQAASITGINAIAMARIDDLVLAETFPVEWSMLCTIALDGRDQQAGAETRRKTPKNTA